MFANAHTIDRIDVPDALERSGVLRFLMSITALIARELPKDTDPRDIAEDGFPATAITAALDKVGDRLYLVHPAHPFMQEPRMSELRVTVQPAVGLRISAPSASSQAWHGRAGDVFTPNSLSVADTPAALMAFWFHNLAGNGGPSKPKPLTDAPAAPVTEPKPGGPKVKKPRDPRSTMCGSVGSHSGDEAHFWWRGTNLAETLLMNLSPYVLSESSLPVWAGGANLGHRPNSLAETTMTGASALLTWDGDQFTSVTLGGRCDDRYFDGTGEAKEETKQALSRAQLADRNRVWVKHPTAEAVIATAAKEGRTVATTGQRSMQLKEANTAYQNLRVWYKASPPDKLPHGVLRTTTGALDVLVAARSLSSGIFGWDSASWFSIDPRTLEADRNARTIIQQLIEIVPVNTEKALYLAAKNVFCEGKSDVPSGLKSIIDGLKSDAVAGFYSRLDHVLEQQLASAADGFPVQDDFVDRVRAAAIEAFTVAVAPFRTTTTEPVIVRTLMNLRTAIRPLTDKQKEALA